MTFEELRQRIASTGHDQECLDNWVESGHQWDEGECICQVARALDGLNELERQLREEVLHSLDNARITNRSEKYGVREHRPIGVEIAHHYLAEILDK